MAVFLKMTGLLVGLVLMAGQLQASDSYRCGKKLVNQGDLEIQVRKKCGKPDDQKVIGYTLKGVRHHGSKHEREYLIERWIYGPKRGFYHEIIFEAGRVVRINQIKE